MTKAQYNSELEKTMKLEKIYGKDSDMIKNRLEWLATVDIEDDVEEDVDDLDFETLYREVYRIAVEDKYTTMMAIAKTIANIGICILIGIIISNLIF